MISKKSPTYLSLFSGCGGFDLGFEKSGFRGLGAFDNWNDAVDVFQKNLRSTCHIADLATASITSREFGKPDVVITGSPCQGFSTLGKRCSTDPRNSLLQQGARIAVRLKPQVIVVENVCGALSLQMRRHWDEAVKIFEQAGYYTITHRLTCSDFGVPQIRRRAFLIASRKSHPEKLMFEQKTNSTLRESMLRLDGLSNHEPVYLRKHTEAYLISARIKQHQKLCNVRGGARAVPTWQIPEVFGKTTSQERKLLESIRRLRRQIRIRDFGDADPLTLNDIKQECGPSTKKLLEGLIKKNYVRKIGQRYDLTHTFNGKYRRLSNSHPSPAVDTRFGSPQYYLHPEENRGFSVREAARIQGFPDDFIFYGSIPSQFRLVGNAVPPPVSQSIATAIVENLL